MDEPALHLRGDAAGLLVHRHDAAGVNRLAFLFVEDLVLRVCQLQTARPRISTGPNSTTCWPRDEDVAQERLIQPGRANRAARIADQRLEILKPGRRVERRPQLETRPAIDAVWPGLSDAIGCRWLRSS